MINRSNVGKIKCNVLTIQINTNIFKENLFGEKKVLNHRMISLYFHWKSEPN